MLIPDKLILFFPGLVMDLLFAIIPHPKSPAILREAAQLSSQEELIAFYKKHNIPIASELHRLV